MPSGNEVNITFEGLRQRAFDARSDMAGNLRNDVGSVNMKFVEAMALVQIAQELNEIKHALVRTTATDEDSIDWLIRQRDSLWPDPSMPGYFACNELIQRYRDEATDS